jgi:hypothetical protein
MTQKGKCIAGMGQEFGAVFHALSEELTNLHWKWNQFRVLFTEKESRFELINRTAPFFFRIVSMVLVDDTALGLARIVAERKSYGQDNLTIRRLGQLVDESLRKEVRVKTKAAVSACEFTLDWRNRHIAHRDLKLAIKSPGFQPLTGVNVSDFDTALSSLAELMNHIEGKLLKSETAYNPPMTGDARELLWMLALGVRYVEHQKRQTIIDVPDVHMPQLADI